MELVSIGTELIKGEHEDNNSPYLLRNLSKIGLDCRNVTVLADFPLSHLVQTLRTIFKRSDLLILSGGLGPTDDDVTREAISRALRRRLIFSPSLLRMIRHRFRKRDLTMPKINERQAYLPKGARAIPNPLGSAPGILIKHGKKILISLPGVPSELRAMFERTVRPYLKRRFSSLSPFPAILLRTTGLVESRVNELLEDLVRTEKKMTFGFYAYPGMVDVKLVAHSKDRKAQRTLRRVVQNVRHRLGPFLFGEGNQTLEEVVFRLLEKKKKTVSVGESCTGGALSSALTTLPGSSRHFKVGVVAYANESKVSFLKVPKILLQRHGAVSDVVAKRLAERVRRLGKTDYGLGVTGILGPGGGTREKQVGLVYFALASSKKIFSHKFYFSGDRETVRLRAVRAALDLLRRELLS